MPNDRIRWLGVVTSLAESIDHSWTESLTKAYIAMCASVAWTTRASLSITIHAVHFLVVHHQPFLIGDSQIEDVLTPTLLRPFV
jgi:hypothetical protein